MKIIFVAAAGMLLAACTTQIHAKDETIQPSKVPLGKFKYAELKPLIVEKMEGDSSDQKAVEKIANELEGCLNMVFPAIKAGKSVADTDTGRLRIEPSIVDLKKVNTGERIFAGALAGSSAVLLKVKYTDLSTQQVVAEPIFYAKAAAMGGAWTFGATDGLMLTRVVENACDYGRKYY
ncbi:hypothetical protein [Ferrovibrio terrae]|uniref:hypothetical protein n=1 Tax=Ferrovibrio terrae TaxID=2594003 RepID=UPI00313777FA